MLNWIEHSDFNQSIAVCTISGKWSACRACWGGGGSTCRSLILAAACNDFWILLCTDYVLSILLFSKRVDSPIRLQAWLGCCSFKQRTTCRRQCCCGPFSPPSAPIQSAPAVIVTCTLGRGRRQTVSSATAPPNLIHFFKSLSTSPTAEAPTSLICGSWQT